MPKLVSTAIIAHWISADRLRAFSLDASGNLHAMSRKSTSDMWSPPEVVSTLGGHIESFGDYLEGLTSA